MYAKGVSLAFYVSQLSLCQLKKASPYLTIAIYIIENWDRSRFGNGRALTFQYCLDLGKTSYRKYSCTTSHRVERCDLLKM